MLVVTLKFRKLYILHLTRHMMSPLTPGRLSFPKPITSFVTYVTSALPAKFAARFPKTNTTTSTTAEHATSLDQVISREPTVLYTGLQTPAAWVAARDTTSYPGHKGDGTKVNPLVQKPYNAFIDGILIAPEVASADDLRYAEWLDSHASRGYNRRESE